MHWRLGGDLGTISLGWCAIALDASGAPARILAMGSRIFSDGRDPKSKQSLAVDRREARAMRRRRDRFKQRQAAVLKHLTQAGLLPPDTDTEARAALEALDPYALRARALHERLEPHEIGRALFHLNQRRGFKSNRRADRKDNEEGKISLGVKALQAAIDASGARTYGEFLHLRRQQASDQNHVPSVRTRMRDDGEGYDFYPSRALLEEEFDAIVDGQAVHHPDLLGEQTRQTLFEVIFHQRPLKTPKVGLCTLLHDTGETRLPKAHPLFQRRRMLEEVNALRIVRPGECAEPLDKAQRDTLLLRLKDKKSVLFETMRAKDLKLDSAARFNKEGDNRRELKGDEVAAAMGAKTRFGPRWAFLVWEAQWEVVRRVTEAQSEADEAALEAWLHAEHRLTPEQARAVIDAPLPEGYGRFGLTATRDLIEVMQAEVIVYSQAVERLGLHHSDLRTGEVFDALPYYGEVLERHILPGTGDPNDPDEVRYGKLTNPTVHIGLNQLRRVLNRLIRAYGPPAEIALELARELKLDEKRKDELNRHNRENREAAEHRSRKIGELNEGLPAGARPIEDKGSNRALMKLWEELNRDNALDRRCVYTGEQISMEMLFSGAVEIDHILPFSDTLDDSHGNRILCTREANRKKRKRSPFEAFGHLPEWEAIAARAARLPKEKRWRFEPDALRRFDADGGFLARQLTDTQHLSRLAREYVGALYPERGEGSGKVWVSPGRLTEMLRRAWGLNSLLPDHNYAGGADQPKNRLDHRHHAIDALVVAVTDRGMLNRIAREAGRRGHEEARALVRTFDEPWEGFRDDVQTAVNRIVVSHRPDHGRGRRRVAVRDLTLEQLNDHGVRVVDEALRVALRTATMGRSGEAFRAALDEYASAHGMHGRLGRVAVGIDREGTTAGRLHNDTAYGLTGRTEKGCELVVHRVPLVALKPDDLVDGGRRVADDALRAKLAAATAGATGKAFTEALRRFAATDPTFAGVRRVRVVEPLSVIPIRDKAGRAYKAYKGDSNYRYDVWELAGGKWVSEVVSMFDAHQGGWISAIRREHHNPRKVLSLHRDDLLAVDRGAGRELLRVVKFSENQFALAPPNEGGPLKARDADKADPFRYVYPSPNTLKAWGARQVRIDELGRVQDPGPRTPPPSGPPAEAT